MKVTFRVLQGLVVGPILLILYTNSLTQSLSTIQVTMHANDFVIIFRNPPLKNVEVNSLLQQRDFYQYPYHDNFYVNPNERICLHNFKH